ncbi:MAG: VOC family protein [Janthinobacterium lividum]
MSRIFGPVTQNGYVVEDLDAAIDNWTRVLGIGPFFKFPVGFESYCYRGKEISPTPELMVAIGNSGNLQIELIQQTNDAPSQYLDFLRECGPGLQHLSVWTESYEADLERFKSLGYEIDLAAKLKGAGRVVFYDTGVHAGAMMEVLEFLPSSQAVMKFVREAAIGWDGSEPVRSLPGTLKKV